MEEILYKYDQQTQIKDIPTNLNMGKYMYNEKYINILYVLLKNNYTYYSEIRRVIRTGNNYRLMTLLCDNIIEEYNPTKDELLILKKKQQLGDFHLNKMTFYRLTNEAFMFYNKNENAEHIYSNTTPVTKLSVLKNEQDTKEVSNRIKENKAIEQGLEELKLLEENVSTNMINVPETIKNSLQSIGIDNMYDYKQYNNKMLINKFGVMNKIIKKEFNIVLLNDKREEIEINKLNIDKKIIKELEQLNIYTGFDIYFYESKNKGLLSEKIGENNYIDILNKINIIINNS